jgi:cell division protein ZapE
MAGSNCAGRSKDEMTGSVFKNYQERVAGAGLEPDAAQRSVALRLSELQATLEAGHAQSGILAGIRAQVFGVKPVAGPKGLYIHGPVGRGKTMLMDLFYDETRFQPKRRAHFHEFMADVHDRIGLARETVPGDPIPHVARDISAEAKLLCFDELHVTTSNTAPNGLYKNGLNRQLFLPFVGLIERHMDAVELAAAKDFRLSKIQGTALYLTPLSAAAHAALDAHWHRLTGGQAGKPAAIEFKGRKLRVPLAAMGVARFAFEDLCDRPLSSLDYLHIAHAFHTVIIDGIPVLDRSRRDIARRFINLIDTLYDCRVCLIASAAAEPHLLYPAGDGADLFERTASRLIEMRSERYLAKRSQPGG